MTVKGKKGIVRIKVYKDGKLLKEHEQEMNSFLRNYDHIIALLSAHYRYSPTKVVTLYDQAGNSIDVYGLKNTSNNPPRIHLGEGTTPVSPDDYQLASKFGATNVTAFDYDSANRTITVRGSWTNNKGYEVTLNEVGLTFQPTLYNSGTGDSLVYEILVIRDLLDSPVTIPDGASVTVEFTITVQVSG